MNKFEVAVLPFAKQLFFLLPSSYNNRHVHRVNHFLACKYLKIHSRVLVNLCNIPKCNDKIKVDNCIEIGRGRCVESGETKV